MKSAISADRIVDFPGWYQEVVAKAELADNGPVRGTMIIRPNGFAIWELVRDALDGAIRKTGARNCYFPMFIPESYLSKEADHVEGFSPELAVVTHAGGKQLDQAVVVRPTSETIINASFSKWIQSYRDLPLLLNQWANVVRWELRPRLFLRTTEFLWQEGHTAHATEMEARSFARLIHEDVYRAIYRDYLAIPTIGGIKSDAERFAGAVTSYSLEGVMGDGKALQMATSHELGQNFAKAFDTRFTSKDGLSEYVWQSSWGASTRLMGAIIMVHGDQNGLRLPPAIAPVQVVCVLVRDDNSELRSTMTKISQLLIDLGLRCEVDDDTSVPYGRRSIGHELRGTPLRLEFGPREFGEGICTIIRRDTGAKEQCKFVDAPQRCVVLLREVQEQLYSEAEQLLSSSLVDSSSVGEMREIANAGKWAVIDYDLIRELEMSGGLGSGLSTRNLHCLDGSLPDSSSESGLRAYVARSY